MLELCLFGGPFFHACKRKQHICDTGLFPCHCFLRVGLQVSKKLAGYIYFKTELEWIKSHLEHVVVKLL